MGLAALIDAGGAVAEMVPIVYQEDAKMSVMSVCPLGCKCGMLKAASITPLYI